MEHSLDRWYSGGTGKARLDLYLLRAAQFGQRTVAATTVLLLCPSSPPALLLLYSLSLKYRHTSKRKAAIVARAAITKIVCSNIGVTSSMKKRRPLQARQCRAEDYNGLQ